MAIIEFMLVITEKRNTYRNHNTLLEVAEDSIIIPVKHVHIYLEHRATSGNPNDLLNGDQ